MPWHKLAHGPLEAEKTVLMDYMTPLLPFTLYSAARNGYWAILASTLGILLLKSAVRQYPEINTAISRGYR